MSEFEVRQFVENGCDVPAYVAEQMLSELDAERKCAQAPEQPIDIRAITAEFEKWSAERYGWKAGMYSYDVTDDYVRYLNAVVFVEFSTFKAGYLAALAKARGEA